MGRLLFLLVLIALAVWLWRHFTRPARPRASRKPEQEAKPMVRCAHCGVHVPQERALSHEGHWYCSQLHLTQGPQRGER